MTIKNHQTYLWATASSVDLRIRSNLLSGLWLRGCGIVGLGDSACVGLCVCVVGLRVRVLCVLRLCLLWIRGFVGLWVCVSVACQCLFVCCVLRGFV